jgi:ABC-type transporter Mla subunit MlaD
MKKLGDPAIALTVVACSAVLLLALAFALTGNPFDRPTRTLRARFPDITGLQASSLVKYAGAPAGTIHSVRILTAKERLASANPTNTVEVVVALNNAVPPLNQGLIASVASDTLLSDKFLLLSGGDPHAPELANGALVASIAPVTFDAILRDLAGALDTIHQLLGGAQGNALDGILPKIDALLAQLGTTVTEAQGLVANGNGLITNANGLVDSGDGLIKNADQFIASGQALIDTNKEPLNKLIAQLSSAADSLDQLAKRTDKLVKDNTGNVNSMAADGKVSLAELKATSISLHALVDSLRARPQQLIWGPGRPARPSR